MVSYLAKPTLKSLSPGPKVRKIPSAKKGDQNMTPQNTPFWCLFFREGSWVNRWRKRSLPSPSLTEVHLGVCSVVSASSWPHGLYPSRLLCPWDFPGKTTGVGCHFLLWGIFLTQGSNVCLLNWQADSWPLRHLGSTIKQGIRFPLRMAPTSFPPLLAREKRLLPLDMGSLYQSEFAYLDLTKVTPVLLLVLSVYFLVIVP